MEKELKPILEHTNLYNPDEDKPWRLVSSSDLSKQRRSRYE